MELFGYVIDASALSLVVMAFFTLYIVMMAQRRDDFDWGQALRDDGGKVSALRLSIFVSLVVSSWLLIYVTMNVIKSDKDLDALFPYYLAYLGVWSSTPVAAKALDAILAKFGVIKPQP